MKKNYNVSIEDNGSAFLIVINKGTNERLVVTAFSTLGGAWKHIKWMYEIETQEFTVGKNNIPASKWVKSAKELGYID